MCVNSVVFLGCAIVDVQLGFEGLLHYHHLVVTVEYWVICKFAILLIEE